MREVEPVKPEPDRKLDTPPVWEKASSQFHTRSSKQLCRCVEPHFKQISWAHRPMKSERLAAKGGRMLRHKLHVVWPRLSKVKNQERSDWRFAALSFAMLEHVHDLWDQSMHPSVCQVAPPSFFRSIAKPERCTPPSPLNCLKPAVRWAMHCAIASVASKLLPVRRERIAIPRFANRVRPGALAVHAAMPRHRGQWLVMKPDQTKPGTRRWHFWQYHQSGRRSCAIVFGPVRANSTWVADCREMESSS